MEPQFDPDPDGPTTLPLHGHLIGVCSVLWGLWVGWKALQWVSGAGWLSPLPVIVLLVHIVVVISAILFLQRKGIGRQLLVIGLWCSGLMQVPLTFIVLILAFSSPSQGGLIKSYNTDGAQGISLFTVLVVVLNIFSLIGAMSLHRRSVRDAMRPPHIGFVRSYPRLESPEHEDDR